MLASSIKLKREKTKEPQEGRGEKERKRKRKGIRKEEGKQRRKTWRARKSGLRKAPPHRTMQKI
jgi:hypothetical protein